jgi:outer membrane receptor protein involved in Fe transport
MEEKKTGVFLYSLLALIVAVGFISLVPVAVAAEAEEEEEEYTETVEVTGTLIPRPTLEGMSPVTVLEPEQITYSGIKRLEDLVVQLPQVFTAQNSVIANGATGTATVSLRNLGSERTLVLLNGRRLPVGDHFDIAADLNFIPAAMVKRIDVLSGGASSVYGADAVTGVVNFILDDEFEGMKASFNYGVYQHDSRNEAVYDANLEQGFIAPTGSSFDGDNFNFSVAFGGKFAQGKGHASGYVDYRRYSAMRKDTRDYTMCGLYPRVWWGLGDGLVCAGSSTWPSGKFTVYDPVDDSFLATLVLDPDTYDVRPREDADVFNYEPDNYLQRPDERWAGGAFINYEFGPAAEGYITAMVMDDYTEAQIAPSGTFVGVDYLNCDNPMMSPEQRAALCTANGYGDTDLAHIALAKRSVETGPRYDSLRHTAYRLIAGVRGDFADAWSYDVYGLQTQTTVSEVYNNDLNIVRAQEALLVELIDPAGPNEPANWQCTSGDPNCVPWNVFTQGGVTQEAADYIRTSYQWHTTMTTQMVEARLTGDLLDYGVKFPGATEGLQVALGAAYRKENLRLDPDEVNQLMLAAGTGAPVLPIDDGYDVTEFFAEVLIPIVQGASGAEDLSLEIGYRHSDYSSTGTQPTYKAQLTYAPVKSFKIRGGIARAIRAPNIVELFAPPGLSLGGARDICAGDIADLDYDETQCARTGVTAAQYGNIMENPAGQYNTFSGGNADLDPEEADTLTAGIVITPTGLPGFTATIDYFKIKMEETIGNYSPEAIILNCALGDADELCDFIHRDGSGSLWLTRDGFTEIQSINIGEVVGEGIDFSVGYLQSLGEQGFLNLNLAGTYTMESSLENDLYGYDCVGLFGDVCLQPTPEWRHRATFSWETGFNAVFNVAWRFTGSVLTDYSSDDPDLGDPATVPDMISTGWGAYKIDDYNLFDLSGTYNFNENVQITVGVNNILDKSPPLSPGYTNNDYGMGWYGTYDPWGRLVHASLRLNY